MNTDVRSPHLALGRAYMLASGALRDVRRQPGIASAVCVGDVRRYAPSVERVALLASTTNPDATLDAFAGLPFVTRVQSRSTTAVTVATDRGSITLHVTRPEHEGAALLWHTGSTQHCAQLSARASRFGLRFDEGQLTDSAGAVEVDTEAALYGLLDLPFIPPELREGHDEIARAERDGLPTLVAADDIRGDLHLHSTWSDGRDSLEAMVYAAHQLGYAYVAITDHSERSLASRNLARTDIARQRRDVETLRAQLTDMTILHGVEVDIMRDGSLDFSDDVLEGFDIVLASLHDHGGQTGDELMSRYLRAIAHPLVNVITHPANRTPGMTQGYALDFDALFAAAAATGTAMEIDGAPGHLDLDGTLARRAAAAGVTLVIDSDCHRTEALARQMRFGVGTARRGWIQPHQVLNTRRIDDVRTFIAAKRGRT